MKIISKSYRVLLPIAIIIAVAIFSCQNQPVDPAKTTINENSISGTLIDEQGTGIASAVITVYQPSQTTIREIANATTDENGKFLLTKLPTNISDLNVKILHPDFKSADEKLTDFKVKSTNPVVLCHNDTCKGVINFWTFKLNDSTKLSDVAIRMYRNGTLIRKGLTIDGKLIFTNVCPGEYIIEYSKSHYATSYDTLISTSSDTINLHEYLLQTSSDSCCNGKIVISVKDSSTNSALPSVKAYLYEGKNNIKYSYSDNSGVIIFEGICPGDYTVSLCKTGYISQSLSFHLNCNDSTGANALLSVATSQDSCCNGALKVFLIDKSTGKAPTNKVTVNLLLNGKVIQTQASTSYAYFSKLCEGTYQIHIVSSYYETLTFDYKLPCNSLDTITKHLVPSQTGDTCCKGKIDVIFKDSTTHALLKGVAVYLYQGGTKLAAQSTDVNGVVHFTGICKGDFTIKSSLSGYNSYNFTLTMDCNDTISSIQYLSKPKSTDTCCTAKLIVTVLDSTDGTPVSVATVYIIRTDGTTITGTTDANGQYTADGLCAPVTYKVKAIRSDYNYYYVPVTFYQCNTQSVTIKILKK